MSDVVYKPSKWGLEFHSLEVDEALGAGAAGPGKTTVLLAEPIPQINVEHQRCLGTYDVDPKTGKSRHPLRWAQSVGWALFLRRTFPELEQVIQRAKVLYTAIDPNVRWDSKLNGFIFSSGYRVQFGHCQNAGDWIKYYGNEYTLLLFDELATFEQEQYEQIRTRLRTADPVLIRMLKTRSMSNPYHRREAGSNGVKDPNWVRKRFVDPEPEGRVVLEEHYKDPESGEPIVKSRIYLPATLYDNPNKEFVKEYIGKLVDKPAHIQQALIWGNWYIIEGSYYGDDWNPAIHIVKPFRVPDGWLVFRALDWGFKSPGVCLWFAMDYDENLYVVREHNFKGKDAKEVAKDIRDIEKDMGLWVGNRSAISGWADTQLWEERGDQAGTTKAEDMAREGVVWMQADKKSRMRNAERLITRLRDHNNGTTKPGIMFFKTCKKCIQTIPVIQADPDKPEEPQEGGDDHWHDAVVYGCAGASRGRAGIPRQRRASERDEERDSVPRGGRGRSGYGERY